MIRTGVHGFVPLPFRFEQKLAGHQRDTPRRTTSDTPGVKCPSTTNQHLKSSGGCSGNGRLTVHQKISSARIRLISPW